MVATTIAEIDRMLHPKSMSIIGASNKPGSFGRMFLEGVIRYGFEKIYPVHPRDTEMLGLKAYPSIKDIPYDVELAILMTPPADTLRIVGECAQKGLKGIVIFTAGFGEKGPEGKKIEQEMAKIAHQAGFRIIGPNSLGLHCPESKLLDVPPGINARHIPRKRACRCFLAQRLLCGLSYLYIGQKGHQVQQNSELRK